MRPGTVMPALFGDDDDGRVERYAVAHYLASLGGPVAANTKPTTREGSRGKREARGEKLFNTIGCVACHGEEKKTKGEDKKDGGLPFIASGPAHFPLTGLGSKTTPEKLAEYLQNPLAIDPSGRMPHMLVDAGGGGGFRAYLCQTEDATIKPDLPEAPAEEKLLAAFKQIDPKAED